MPTAGDLFQALVRKIGRKKLRRNFFRIFLWGLNPKTDYNPLHSISTPSQTLKKHSQPVLKKLVSLDSTIVSSLSGLVGLVSGKRFPSVYLATSKTRAWLLPLRTAFVNKGSRPCFRDHLTPIFLPLKLVLKNFRKKSKFSRSKFFHLEKWSKIFEKSQNFISRIIDINLVSNHLFVINVHCESGSKFFQP